MLVKGFKIKYKSRKHLIQVNGIIHKSKKKLIITTRNQKEL